MNTVDSQADNYTHQAYKNAVLAHKFQNIIMQPRSCELADVSIKHLQNCPIMKEDIRAAEDIISRNLGSLKGKTVHQPNPHVLTHSKGVPNNILRVHQKVTLAIDIIFINKFAFFMTVSRNIKFGTVEALSDQKVTTIAQKLKTIISLY